MKETYSICTQTCSRLDVLIDKINNYRPIEVGKLYADTYIKQTQVYMKKIINDNDKLCNPIITSMVHKFLTKQSGESLSYLWKIIKMSINSIYRDDQDILKLIPSNVQYWKKDSYVMAIKKFIVYLVSNDDEYDINLEENQNNIIISYLICHYSTFIFYCE